MNCANHPELAAAAYCRTCGKPLCSSCTRDVKGVIYCENCLAARLEGTPAPPPTVYQQIMDQGLGLKVPPSPGPGPNPTVAGILAGFFPFGVGAVYCGQYAKGLAHLLIFTGLIWGQATTDSDGMHIALGFGIAFFYVYQIIDAIRTARAVQTGQPVPDPFGLTRTFSTGDKVDASRIPGIWPPLAPDPDLHRRVAVRAPDGPAGSKGRFLRVRSVPRALLDGTSRACHARHSVPAGPADRHSLRPHLAAFVGCHRSDQGFPGKCFDGRPYRRRCKSWPRTWGRSRRRSSATIE